MALRGLVVAKADPLEEAASNLASVVQSANGGVESGESGGRAGITSHRRRANAPRPYGPFWGERAGGHSVGDGPGLK